MAMNHLKTFCLFIIKKVSQGWHSSETKSSRRKLVSGSLGLLETYLYLRQFSHHRTFSFRFHQYMCICTFKLKLIKLKLSKFPLTSSPYHRKELSILFQTEKKLVQKITIMPQLLLVIIFKLPISVY